MASADSGASRRAFTPEMTYALRVLLMVHELHKRGHQRLRILPGMAPSGLYWRCSIWPLEPHAGAEAARYTSGMKNRYFGWDDAENDGAPQLADKFAARFPGLVAQGAGPDWRYAGWYVAMLGFAERGHFPVAYDDWYGEAPPYWAKDGERLLPFPPPAEDAS